MVVVGEEGDITREGRGATVGVFREQDGVVEEGIKEGEDMVTKETEDKDTETAIQTFFTHLLSH